MNAKQVWQAALGELQVKVPGPSFQTWLKNTSIADFQDNVVVIAVPSNFAKEWLEKRFSKLIAETLHNVLNHKVEVQFEVKTPARGTSAAGRALHALDGVGVEKETHELPMVVGGNPNPYTNKVTNGHGPNGEAAKGRGVNRVAAAESEEIETDLSVE